MATTIVGEHALQRRRGDEIVCVRIGGTHLLLGRTQCHAGGIYLLSLPPFALHNARTQDRGIEREESVPDAQHAQVHRLSLSTGLGLSAMGSAPHAPRPAPAA